MYFIRTAADGSQILLFDSLGSTVGLLDSNGVFQTDTLTSHSGQQLPPALPVRTRSNIREEKTMGPGSTTTGPDTTVPRCDDSLARIRSVLPEAILIYMSTL